MTAQELIANIDIDGVLTDSFQTQVKAYAETRGMQNLVFDKWHFWEDWSWAGEPVTFEEFWEDIWEELIWNGMYQTMGLNFRARRFVENLKERSFRIRLITHMGFPDADAQHAACEDRLRNISNWSLPIDDIVFVSGPKNVYPSHIAVDDKPSTDWQHPDAINVLFQRPWNKGFEDYDYAVPDYDSILTIIDEEILVKR